MNPVKIVTVTMAQIPYCQPLFRFLNVSLGLIPIHNILFFDTGHRSKFRFKLVWLIVCDDVVKFLN